MKNKKGFTLVELLAVIVILAVIGLIAVPIIINLIEDAKKGSAKDSAYGYIEAIDKNNSLASIHKDRYTKIADGENIDVTTLVVNIKGQKPESGELTILNGRVSYANLCINGYNVEYDGKKAKITGKCIKAEIVQVEDSNPGIICGSEKSENYDSMEECHIKSIEDLVAFSKLVNSGKDFSNKIVYLDNNLDFLNDLSYINPSGKSLGDINNDGIISALKEELTKGKGFSPIGNNSNKFNGTFEGNAKTISNLFINRPSDDYIGLFGYNTITIKGLGLKNVNIIGNNYVGGLCGKTDGTVYDVTVSGTIKGENNTGGVAGYVGAWANPINSVLVNVDITGNGYVGTVTGYNGAVTGAIIEGGSITATSSNKGTIIGATNGSTPKNAYYFSDIVYTNTVINGSGEYSPLSKGNLNAYESAVDTWIGGDDDNSGYYFDYNKKGELIIKSTKENPIKFNLKGSGTESDPYLISSYQDWKEATIKADQAGIVFKLTKDIDFTDKNFYMLGSYQNKFTGILDGNGHKLIGIKTTGGYYQGILGYINSSSSVIKNLIIENAEILNTTNYVGTVVGKIDAGTIENININNTTISGNKFIGGLIGEGTGTIKGINLKNINITGVENTGGLAGKLNSEISEIVVRGNINGSNYTGGLAGNVGSWATPIKSIIVNANISGGNYTSGITGYNGAIDGAIVESGSITGGSKSEVIGAQNGSTKKTYYSSSLNIESNIVKDATLFDSTNENNLSYYSSLLNSSNNPIIETTDTGDINGSGYVFTYGTDNKIKVIKVSTE